MISILKMMINDKSIGAGYLIGLASYIYSSCIDKKLGAIFFGIGLITICAFYLPLFTGKIGENSLFSSVPTFIGNAFGMGLAIMLFRILPATSWYPTMLSLGIACGSLMQIAVAIYSKHPWITIMCVAAFILSGFKHCIAMIFNSKASLEWTIAFIFVIIGNIIGAKFVAFFGVRKENIK